MIAIAGVFDEGEGDSGHWDHYIITPYTALHNTIDNLTLSPYSSHSNAPTRRTTQELT